MKIFWLRYLQAHKHSKGLVRINICFIGIGIVLFCLNQLLLKRIISWFWIHCYFNDSIAGTVFLACCSLILLAEFPQGLSLKQEIILIVIAGIFWEFIAPLYMTKSVTDYFDLYAYAIGGVVYQAGIMLAKRVGINKMKDNKGEEK